MSAPPPSSPDRLRHLRAADRDDEQQKLYEAITGGRRATGPTLFALVDAEGGLQGPFEAMLRSPAVGSALEGLGAAVRYGTGLSGRIREMAILAVAAHWTSDFERHAHEAVGRHIGLTDHEMAALRGGSAPELADPDERAALFAVTALLRDGDLDDESYAEVTERLGERGVFELTTLVGYYATLALQLRVFRVAAPGS